VFTYDVCGRFLTQTDALANRTSFTYDASGNLSTTTERHGEHHHTERLHRPGGGWGGGGVRVPGV